MHGMRNEMDKRIKMVCLLLAFVLLCGCGSSQTITEEAKELETGFIPARAGMYDSADTALIKKLNEKEKKITFYNLVKGRSYTLTYDGTTKLHDKYGSSLSMKQLKEGDIVEITFLKEKKTLASLQKSDDCFVLENVEKFSINEKTGEITVGSDVYKYEDDLLVVSNGKQAEIMDINESDTLRIQGMDHTVYSIAIDKGHGYLRLKNDEYFWGGWIEVGQRIIRPIEEDMLLVVPEGKYDVLLSTNGVSATKKVTIKRDKETELDIGDLKKEDLQKYGTLLFAVTPDTATIYIDGEQVDISAPVEVEYGIHQMMAKAEEYQTVIQYIKVGQESATIQVTMEKDNGKTVSGNTTSTTTTTDETAVSANGTKLSITAPEGAEVYMDGSYIGIVPVSVKKTEGIHVITLRQEGYETRSYTINITDLTKDESMSFSALVKAEEKSSEDTGENDSSDKKEGEKSVSQNG